MMHEAEVSTDEPGEQVIAASAPYVGQWQRLVSTTNWQKGRIIGQWRESLAAQGVPPAESSDEAWARLVGGVTGQHAGRLRRVFARFGAVHEQYDGLFWSHFQAALDWDDAEMWLQGATSSGWSVARMRDERRRTLGLVEESAEAAEEVDEDAGEIADFGMRNAESRESAEFGMRNAELEQAEVRVPRSEDEDEDEDDSPDSPPHREADASRSPIAAAPFAELPELPDDLAEAFETMKLAILRHKAQAWREVSLADVLGMLEGLRELAAAPAG